MNPTIETLRARLQQLQAAHARGELSAEEWAQARAPLEREMVRKVMASEAPASSHPLASSTGLSKPATGDQPARPSRRLWAGVLAGIVVLASIGYTLTGSPRLALQGDLPPAAAQAPAGDSTPPVTEEQVREMVDRLAQRLQEQPDDLVGWTMLARAYTAMGRSDDAAAAFRRALALAPRDAGLMADLADALAAQRNGDLSGEPTQLVQQALQIDPANLKALALSGSAAFDRRDYAAAVRQWEQVRAALPPDSAFIAQVDSSIAQARQLGGLPPANAASAGAAASSAAGASSDRAAAASAISGTLSVAPALKGRAAPDDTVYLIARPADGSRLPLAVLRKQVRDLPLQFTLDDSLAMAPTARISDHPQVIVVARISKSGNPLPQPGDLSGESQPVAPGTAGLRIEIGGEVQRGVQGR